MLEVSPFLKVCPILPVSIVLDDLEGVLSLLADAGPVENVKSLGALLDPGLVMDTLGSPLTGFVFHLTKSGQMAVLRDQIKNIIHILKK